MKSYLLIPIVALALLGACKNPNQASNSPAPAVTPVSPAVIAPITTPVKQYIPTGYTLLKSLSEKPVRSFKKAPEYALDDKLDYVAVMNTDVGRMVIALYASDTPTTVNSFVFLARNKYYDGIAFHRVMDNFVVQGGDPFTLEKDSSRWGTGGAGYEYCLEVRAKYKFDTKGVIGMARTSDPCANGSQFYITLAATPNLDGQYTVFGKVIEGLDVLDKVVRGEPPATPTRMTSVYIVTKNK